MENQINVNQCNLYPCKLWITPQMEKLVYHFNHLYN